MPPASPRKRTWAAISLGFALASAGAAAAAFVVGQRLRERQLADVYRDSLAGADALESELAKERERARRDPLTGCLNHAVVIDELRRTLDSDATASVALIDVDGLKATNDLYGHQAGDSALRIVASALQTERALVGRYGGDEFVVVLPGADRGAADGYRNQFLNTLATARLPAVNGDADIPIVASMGLATFPDDARSAEQLLKLADNAMYTERRKPAPGRATVLRFDSERVTKLISDIVPLLTSKGTRQEKLEMVAQHLSVGTGYEAVNIEVAGVRAGQEAEWENTFVSGSREGVDAWRQEQHSVTDHPLGKSLAASGKPAFIADLHTDERMTPNEREILKKAGLKSALVVPMLWQEELVGMLSVASSTESPFGAWDAQFLSAVAMHVTAIVFMTELVEELQAASEYMTEAHAETVLMLAAAAEAYDDTTGSHIIRVRSITEALAREIGYDDHDVWRMGLAAVLHDVGKIRVPSSVLTSPRSLTEQEWVEMRRHTIWGSELLQGRRGFELAAQVARCHHERWDGGGYPEGLRGAEIPEPAAIVSVADSFDAITSDRPYRAARSADEALREINAFSGVQFNPNVVEALNRLASRGELPGQDEVELKAA